MSGSPRAPSAPTARPPPTMYVGDPPPPHRPSTRGRAWVWLAGGLVLVGLVGALASMVLASFPSPFAGTPGVSGGVGDLFQVSPSDDGGGTGDGGGDGGSGGSLNATGPANGSGSSNSSANGTGGSTSTSPGESGSNASAAPTPGAPNSPSAPGAASSTGSPASASHGPAVSPLALEIGAVDIACVGLAVWGIRAWRRPRAPRGRNDASPDR